MNGMVSLSMGLTLVFGILGIIMAFGISGLSRLGR